MKKVFSSIHRSKAEKGSAVSKKASNSTSNDTFTSQKPKGRLGITVLHDPPQTTKIVVDIVFVHGLTGDAAHTWTHKDSENRKPWPAELLSSDLPGARIMSFGYDADVVNVWSPASQNRIGNHALDLLGGLTRERAKDGSEHRKLLFVAHSLGGLLVQDCLCLSKNNADEHLRNLSSCTIGLAFLGTPNHGSDRAAWAHFGTNLLKAIKRPNSDIVAVLEPGSEMLARIQNGFHGFLRIRAKDGPTMDVTCFYEELPHPIGGMIVKSESAIIPGYHHESIHADHTDMTKFGSKEDDGYQKVVGELRRWTKKTRSIPGAQAPKSSFFVPFYRDNAFIDHPEIFEKIEQQAVSRRRIALSGSGGVGKSQIAIEKCYRTRDAERDTSIFWVYARTYQRFAEAYRDIARRLRISGWDDKTIDTLQLVVEWLEDDNNGPWLMILDNADDLGVLSAKSKSADTNDVRPISSYLPHAAHGTILITTRDDRVSHELGCHGPIVVEPMSPRRACSLLESHLAVSGEGTQNDLEALCKTLDYIPLAITQAAAFIKQYKTTIVKYIKMFSDNESEVRDLLSDNLGDDRRDWQSQNSVFGTLKLSFDLISEQDSDTMVMLSSMVYLDRQGITEELFIMPETRMIDFERAIGTLRAFSLISVRSDKSGYDLHRLVQLATRYWAETIWVNKEPELLALCAVTLKFPQFNEENTQKYESLLPHALAVSKICVRDDTYAKCSLALSKTIALYFMKHGAFKAALHHGLAGLAVSKDWLGPRSSTTVEAMYLVALIYGNTRKYQEAEQLFKAAIEIEQEERGPESEVALKYEVVLSKMYREIKKPKKAGLIQERALELAKRMLGPQHPKTLIIMSELACTYRLQGQTAQSNTLVNEAFGLSLQHSGPEDHDHLRHNVFIGMVSGGLFNTVQGCLEQNSSFFNGLESLYSQAQYCERRGDFRDAIAIFGALAEAAPQLLGPDHPIVLGSIEHLENCRELQKRRERLYQDKPALFSIPPEVISWEGEE